MTTQVRSTFENPLTREQRRPFDHIKFGQLLFSEPEMAVRRRMNQGLFETLHRGLPAARHREAEALVRGYGNGFEDFFILFYPFVWSFLYWLPTSHRREALPIELVRAHGLSLFLHLWDDHLCDGQLPVDMLRLQIRTAVWSRP